MKTPRSNHPRRSPVMRLLALACAAGTLVPSALPLSVWAQSNSSASSSAQVSAPRPVSLAPGSIGRVEFARGVGFAQAAGQQPRTLGQGLPLAEGDRLTTAEGATAIIQLQDGTRMTVRPNSELVLAQYRFRENADNNSFVTQLVRGGLRAITGVISKNAPNAARIQTATATIGIRGTDFDARICRAGECTKEVEQITDRARANAVQASAKVVQSQGEVNAVQADGQRRRLVDGGAVYPGDLVETGPGTRAVLAFRDDSRVTLGAATRFKVDNFVFDDKNPREGRFLVSLLRGSMRAVTGLIAKGDTRNVRFSTATATIGIRGTGFDADCSETGCAFFSWLNTIEIAPSAGGPVQLLPTGRGVIIQPDGGSRPLAEPILNNLPRPDGVKVNPRELFTRDRVDENQEGLFVFVRDGHIEVASSREVLHLGRGEAGYADGTGLAVRPDLVPRFIDFDRVPLPDVRNPNLLAMLVGSTPVRTGPQCR